MTKNQPAEGPQDVVYQVRLPLSKRTIDLVAGLIRRRRNQLGTRWRKLTPGAQAVVLLAVLRHDQRLADMAGGNHVSASTVRRWVLEVLTPLSARAPRLDPALKKIARSGGAVFLLDGAYGHSAGRCAHEWAARRVRFSDTIWPAIGPSGTPLDARE